MSFLHAAALAGASGNQGPYQIEQSLRFDGAARLYRTQPASQTRTYSFWYKYSDLDGGNSYLFHHKNSDDSRYLGVRSGGSPSENQWQTLNQGSSFTDIFESRKYRDPSAWQHFVFKCTSSNVTQYVNGVEFASAGGANAALTGGTLEIGARSSAEYFGGYIAEFHLVDGTALDPASFGEEDDNGVWRPIKYTGSYGSNGVYLKFDETATNGIGHDHSGNGNNFTASGFTTSGTGTDVMSDTPTTNWCTLNPVDNGGATLAEGNLSWDSGSNQGTRSTFFVDSGKWYWELTSNESNLIGEHGVADASQVITGTTAYPGYAASSWGFSNSTGNKVNNNSFTNIATTGSQNDVIMVALDMDDGKIWWGRNGTWFSSGDPAAGSNAAFTNLSGYNVSPMSGVGGAAAGAVIYNFGQRAFAYTPPTGFKALNTSNLPAPDIADGSDYFNTVLYTGTQGTLSVTGVGFQPDFVWIKNRGSAVKHMLFDSVRNVRRSLSSVDVNQEEYESSAGYLSAFGTDGFTVVEGTSAGVNWNNDTFVSWNWLASNSASSNTDGTITSTVSVNATAGFSIVTYTGDGDSAATVGHGLGVTPNFVLVRRRTGGLGNWQVGETSIFGIYEMYLNTADGITDGANEYSVTSTVIDLNSSHFGTNASGSTYVAYCFAEVEGYSKIGTYIGNGSSDGVFVHTGMAPAFILVKNKDGGENWLIFDTTRKTFNENDTTLSPNVSSAEVTSSTNEFDILSNGFKARNSSDGVNKSGQGYIFVAFAEHPFGGSGVSAVTAR